MESMAVCPNCSAQLNPGARFCRACGARLEPRSPPQPDPTEEATTVAPASGSRQAAGGELPAGTRLGDYRVVRLVGAGGMGSVYEAVQESLERRVALKLITAGLSADPQFRERFRSEARLAAALEHPGILPVYELGETPEGQLFVAMRFIDGMDLSSHLQISGPLQSATALALLSQVATALDAAHAAGLVHRDVKPGNVLLEDSSERAYLADFGLAKEVDEHSVHTQTGELLGTVDYMAPEQIEGGKVDQAVDVYAFACMVYRCLTGEVPYRRDSRTATLVAHVNAPLPLATEKVVGLSAVWDDVIRWGMQKDPARRARSCGALMDLAQQRLTAAPGSTADTIVAPQAANGRPQRFGRALIARIVIYAPLWTAAYIAGRHL